MLDRLRGVVRQWKQEPKEPVPTIPVDMIAPNENTLLSSYIESLPQSPGIHVDVYGGPHTGKDCFLSRLTRDQYSEGYNPCTEEPYYMKRFEGLSGHGLPFQLDPAYPRFPPGCGYGRKHKLHCYVITYNVGDRRTFESLGELHDQVLALKHEDGQVVEWQGGLVLALACDRSEEPGAVKSSDGRQFAEQRQLDFYETSAKMGHGCAEADFEKMVRSLLLPAAYRFDEDSRLSPYLKTVPRTSNLKPRLYGSAHT